MTKVSLSLGCLALSAIVATSSGATLNVEEGTTTTGWYDSLNDAIGDADNDDTIYVYPGMYTDEITHQIPSGVTIRGRYSSNRPTIKAPSGSSDVFRLDRSGESGISLINLIIDADDVNASGTGVKITGNATQGYSTDIVISNCVVKNAPGQGILITENCTGCFLTMLTVYENGTVAGLDHGIYSHETVTIKDCEIFDNKGAGIHLWLANKIGPAGTKVYRNELYDNRSYDICAGNGDDFEIFNNIIYTTNLNPPGLDEGIRIIGNGADHASGHMIYHNTIYNKTKGVVIANAATENTKIRNCIFYQCTTNIDDIGGENPTDTNNLKDTDPDFVDAPNDLHITSTSAAIDYCPTLTEVGDDYDTDDRLDCEAEAGADEY